MRRFYRYIITIYSLLVFLLSGLFLSFLLMPAWLNIFTGFIQSLNIQPDWQYYTILVALIISILAALLTCGYAITQGKLYDARLKNNEIGVVDIGVAAIQNIVLNSSKSAQAGIKSAKARVYSTKGGRIKIELDVYLYSDVEIPAQMAKIQERVKKDVERLTSISVSQVSVNVKNIELTGARVEK